MHFRFKLNLSINVLKKGTKVADHKIKIKNAVIDVINPLGMLRLKLLVNLDELSLVASKE